MLLPLLNPSKFQYPTVAFLPNHDILLSSSQYFFHYYSTSDFGSILNHWTKVTKKLPFSSRTLTRTFHDIFMLRIYAHNSGSFRGGYGSGAFSNPDNENDWYNNSAPRSKPEGSQGFPASPTTEQSMSGGAGTGGSGSGAGGNNDNSDNLGDDDASSPWSSSSAATITSAAASVKGFLYILWDLGRTYRWAFAPLLHNLNKLLLCWTVPGTMRDSVVKTIDVGFLSFLGVFALIATRPSQGTYFMMPVVHLGLAHMVLEMVINGWLIPYFSTSKKGLGLRPDIWLHHIFCILSFTAVACTGILIKQACLLTVVETTSVLPVAFAQARTTNRLKGNKNMSYTLAGLMAVAFAFRVIFSVYLVLPIVSCAPSQCSKFLAAQKPSYALAYATIAVCGLGLTLQNIDWFSRVVQGIAKVASKRSASGSGSASKNSKKSDKKK